MRQRLSDFVELTKPRITALVVLTAAAGFYVASSGAVDRLLLLHTLLATALVAGGTSAANHVAERDQDGRMRRTRNRPLPAGRVSPRTAGVFSAVLTTAGIVWLALAVNLLTAALAAATFVLYIGVYTPLKRVHSISTLVGAIPGALPIAGGWTAVTGDLSPGAFALFGIMFLWQIPHFLALAWLLRYDYQDAGFPMLSVGDPRGMNTRVNTVLYTVALLPVSLAPAILGLAGAWYFWIALGLGTLFIVCAVQFWGATSEPRAGRLFRFSVIYLPVLLVVLAVDKA